MANEPLPVDPINASVWNDGRTLLQNLNLPSKFAPGDIRPQQISPLPQHHHLFGPRNPLSMVPDFLGSGFQGDNTSPKIFVCGSTYAGFMKHYSKRHLTAETYAQLRDLNENANPAPHVQFSQVFFDQVIGGDTLFYSPLLAYLGYPERSAVCIGDVCKCSFIRIGAVNAQGTRHDLCGDNVVVADLQSDKPQYPRLIRTDWIYDRMIQADLVIALGTMAEQNLATCFYLESNNRGHSDIAIRSRLNPAVIVPINRMNQLRAGVRLQATRTMKYWKYHDSIADCWTMKNGTHEIMMRPIVHPAAQGGDFKNNLPLANILQGLGLA